MSAWYNEHDWHVRPETLVDVWKNSLIEKGVQFQERCRGEEYLNHSAEQVVIEEWTGLRPMTYDDLPVLFE